MNCPKENNVCDKNDSKYRSDELRKENRKLNVQIEELQDTENDLRKKKMEFMREIDSLRDTVRKLESSNTSKNQNENADTERKIKMLAATVESLTSEKKSLIIEQNRKIVQQVCKVKSSGFWRFII